MCVCLSVCLLQLVLLAGRKEGREGRLYFALLCFALALVSPCRSICRSWFSGVREQNRRKEKRNDSNYLSIYLCAPKWLLLPFDVPKRTFSFGFSLCPLFSSGLVPSRLFSWCLNAKTTCTRPSWRSRQSVTTVSNSNNKKGNNKQAGRATPGHLEAML